MSIRTIRLLVGPSTSQDRVDAQVARILALHPRMTVDVVRWEGSTSLAEYTDGVDNRTRLYANPDVCNLLTSLPDIAYWATSWKLVERARNRAAVETESPLFVFYGGAPGITRPL